MTTLAAARSEMSRLLTALLPVASLAVAIGVAMTTQSWNWWGVDPMVPRTPASTSFADLAHLTATADCLRLQQPIEGCDPYGRPFMPYVVLPARLLAGIGWGTTQTGTLGLLHALVTIAAVAGLALAIARSWRRSLGGLYVVQGVLALVAISPPVMLGVERGQLEQVILGLVLLSLMSLRHPAPWGWVGTLLSLAATSTKYLSVGMFLPFAVPSALRRRRWPVLLAVAASATLLTASAADIRQAMETSRAGAPQSSRSTFGLAVGLATLLSPSPPGYEPPPIPADRWAMLQGVGLMGFLLLVALFTVALRRLHVRLPSSSALVLLLGGGGVPALVFVLGSSYDYRLLFFVPLVAGCVQWIGEGATPLPRLPILLLAFAFAATWIGTAMRTPLSGAPWSRTGLMLGDASLTVTLALVLALWLHHVYLDVAPQEQGQRPRTPTRASAPDDDRST